MLRRVLFIEIVFLICIASSGSLTDLIQSRMAKLAPSSTVSTIKLVDDSMKPGFTSPHLLPRGIKRKTSGKTSGVSSHSRSRNVGSEMALPRIQTKKSLSPGPASSDSRSKSSKWHGSGFTESDSPSSWGSWHSNPFHPPTNAKIWTKGSAVVRTRTMASKRRDFSEVDSGTTATKEVRDSQKTQAAVHVLSNKGNAGISSYGKYTIVRVDARKSKHGGWAGRVDPSGQIDDIVHVLPGTKAKYSVQYAGGEQQHGARGFVQGKGTVKIDSSNVWPSHIIQPRLEIDSPRTSAASGSGYGIASDSEVVSQPH